MKQMFGTRSIRFFAIFPKCISPQLRLKPHRRLERVGGRICYNSYSELGLIRRHTHTHKQNFLLFLDQIWTKRAIKLRIISGPWIFSSQKCDSGEGQPRGCKHTVQQCKARVDSEGAIGSSTAERLCYTLTSPPVSGMTWPWISASRKYTSGLHQTPAASLRHLTAVCSRLFSALKKPLQYLSEADSSQNCLVSTAWSRTDHLVIVSFKAHWHTSTVTQSHLASGCSASPSNARSKCKVWSPILSTSEKFTRYTVVC